MLNTVNLRDHMLLHPAKVRADANVQEAMRVIIANKISGLCVVDDADNLVGILSELDCLRAVLSATYNKTEIGSVKQYMTSDNLVVAHPDEDIVDVAQDMLKNKHRRRPVVENGRLIGQITCRQVLRAVEKFRG